MKIVINALSARLGGGQTYLRNLLTHLPPREDLEVLVFSPRELAIPAHDSVRRVESSWPTTNPLLRVLWEMLLLPLYLRKEGADVLFCPGGVVAASGPRKCLTVTMFRNMIPFDPRVRRSIPWGLQRLRNLILKRVMLRSMAKADLTIFISNYARGVIEALVNIPRAVTIPHGIAEQFRAQGQCPEPPASIPSGEYLLYVSRFDVYKHHYEVVHAYAMLSESLRERFSLVLVGEIILPEAERVKRLIHRKGLGERVHLVGTIPYLELPAVYHRAKLFIFASSCENCPNILLEALASGRPVLSSNLMPMPEFGGDAVEYFSPFEPDQLTNAMIKVLDDDAYAESLGAKATEHSRAFDWAHTSMLTWDNIFALVEASHVR